MRAFIFSLDAFVAFTLALVAIYSLIFFSSIPSSYYYLLTQGHYLAQDSLYSLSTSDCAAPFFQSCIIKGSVLDNIVFGDMNLRKEYVKQSLGLAIPKQFGYVLEVSKDNGHTWSSVYDTKTEQNDPQGHAALMKKLSVSSQVVTFDYSGPVAKNSPNPYIYTSCMGNSGDGSSHVLLTCSGLPASSQYGGGAGTGWDLVPSTGIRLVRLTIFI
jgi:hypothetical protein